jgi:nucleotide-binding universal stress UspA family protein/nitrite reductase/ring-hydroxylating ferredoxin subunit
VVAWPAREVDDVAYKRILFGTDGSERSARIALVATELAKAGKAQLVVTHVWERPDGAEAVLTRVIAEAEAAGVKKVEGELHGGRPAADVLIEVAETRDVGLIVVSGGRSTKVLGPTADRLSHQAPRDLLIVKGDQRGDGTRLYGRVVIATDGSATADRAARKGYDLAESIGAPVTMVFVGHPSTGELITTDTIETYAAGVETDVVITQGDPAERIVRAAKECSADLIVVGNKGMQGAKRFFLNPVPEKVIALADRDVLVARTVAQVPSELGPGEGGIIVQGGERLAAFMDTSGELHLMSARCTHLGCTVAWNPGDAVFECPCHGSRYGPTGEVVNGPAQRPLPPA